MRRSARLCAVVLGLCCLSAGGTAASDPAPASPENSLPLTTVKLYTSGVGYFERSGPIDGPSAVTIPVTASQLNDVLKSLVVQDAQGGRVSLVQYASRDPLAKALGGFGLDLSENRSLGSLLAQLRGERIRLAAPHELEGTILSVETRLEAGSKETTIPVEYVNLVTDAGFRSVALPQIQHVALMNPRLAQEVHQALAMLAARHDTQKTPLTVRFEGSGRRTAHLAYLVETPIWKTTYRLVVEPDNKPWLQGWALVDNPTDQDWTDVRLSLLSGRPISFTMNLSDPLYTARPHVEPELLATIRPQAHDSAMTEVPAKQALAEEKAQALSRRKREDSLRGALAMEAPASAPAEAGLLADLSHTLVPDTRTDDVGSLFQYEIAHPVTIARHQAAMVPIINTGVEGQFVSVYNRRVHAKHPLNGFRLRNSSPVHLMQGPVTVFNGGAYAGDARLLDLAPGQERLVTYALDLKTEVDSQPGLGTRDIQSIVVKKGTLIATRKSLEQTTYTVKNHDHRALTLLVEHPYRSDWKLSDDTLRPERTSEVYRFPVHVNANGSANLVVKEERPIQESAVLSDVALDQLTIYLQAPALNAKVRDALEQLSTMRAKLNDLQVQRAQHEQQLRDIEQEQHRLRDNMQRLDQRSDLYGRYVKKLDAQETEVERLRKTLGEVRRHEDEQRRQLRQFVQGLELAS